MATIIDCEQGPDGTFAPVSETDRILGAVERGLGAVEEAVQTGRQLNQLGAMLRKRIRNIGKPVRNPSRRRVVQPDDVVLDAEEI